MHIIIYCGPLNFPWILYSKKKEIQEIERNRRKRDRKKQGRNRDRVKESAKKSFENFILIMDYSGVVFDIAKTNAIAQQSRLTKTIFYQTKFRIQRPAEKC